jgi:hypothetical protein
MGEEHFLPGLRTGKEKYSWTTLVASIKELAGLAGEDQS